MAEKLILAAIVALAAVYTARAIVRAMRPKPGKSPCEHCSKDCPARSMNRRSECP